MKNRITMIAAGFLLGALVTWLAIPQDGASGGEPAEVVRDLVVTEKMTVIEAAEHRQDRYASLQTVEEIYALPSEFGRAEALYAIAGRADSAGVQALVFDANRIADIEDRAGALNILFFRLAELDPHSALALARTASFRGDRGHERRVWIAWGRRDIDAALAAAKEQSSEMLRNKAAQSLFTAYGYMGNATTDRIEREMGIEPDRNTRGRFIYRLADESPPQAIAFINQMQPGTRQQEFVSWLAHHLGPRDPARAATYAVLFDSARYQEAYEAIVARHAAKADPVEVMDQLLAGGRGGLGRTEIYSAIREIAQGDLDVAMDYYARLKSSEFKQSLLSSIAASLTARDVDEALFWARSNDTGENPEFEMQVLQHLAQRDLGRAIVESRAMANAGARDRTLASVIDIAAQTDPAEAVKYMHLIENPNLRDDAAQQAIHTWFRQDRDAAIDWLLSQDRETANEYLGSPMMMVRTDIGAAIRLLPLVEGNKQQLWRYQIARSLVTGRSAAEAMNFIAQYEGEDGYGNLQQAVITGLAVTDPYAARQMADQLPPGESRDNSYAQLIQVRAASDPREALTWLGQIDNETNRGRAAMGVAGQWYQKDPTAAQHWVSELPPGHVRDDAIIGLVGHWRDYGADEERLISSISNDEKRSSARIRQIYSLVNRNPARARELLETVEISDQNRLQVEQMLRQAEGRH